MNERKAKKWFKTIVRYPQYNESEGGTKTEIKTIENVFHARNSIETREKLAQRLHAKYNVPEVIAHFMANDQNLDIRVINEKQASDHFHTFGFQDGFDDDPCVCCEKRPSCPYKCFEEAGKNCSQY